MGLDAHVNCNCYRSGTVCKPPPKPELVQLYPDGAVDVPSHPLADALEFDRWKAKACRHPGMVLVHHRIGNMTSVGFLRAELSKQPESFPLMLSKVVYSGTHCGDWVPVELTGQLREEALRLRNLRTDGPQDQPLLDTFASQMIELCDCALTASNPVAF